jgi:hypothetical protein
LLRDSKNTLSGLIKARNVVKEIIRRKRAENRIALVLALIMVVVLTSISFCERSEASVARVSNGVEPGTMSFELWPGVVIDPREAAAYLMSPQKGIDRVELSSGRLLWSISSAAKPIAVFDDRLIAQADPHASEFHVLPLVVLATKNDGSVVSRISIPMPTDVMPSVENGLGTSFTTEARVEQARLILWWRFYARTVSGIARPEPLPERCQSGAFAIDLKTYRFSTLTPEQATAAQAASVKAPEAAAPQAFQTPAQLAGKFFFATATSRGHSVLKRWNADSGKSLPDIELEPGFAVATASADGAEILTAKAAGANAAGIENYVWSIYLIYSGERVAQIRIAQSAMPFFLWHSLLIYESSPVSQRISGVWQTQPLELRAIDIRTSTPVWSRAVRETAYSGLFPPKP